MLHGLQRMKKKTQTLHSKVKSYVSFKSKLISYYMNKNGIFTNHKNYMSFLMRLITHLDQKPKAKATAIYNYHSHIVICLI